MTKRAWWLVGLNLIIPGSAQILAGNRRLGRFGVGATFLLWGLGLVGILVWFVAHTVILSILTNPIGLTAIQVVLAAYTVLWIVLTLDTLRLTRLIGPVDSCARRDGGCRWLWSGERGQCPKRGDLDLRRKRDGRSGKRAIQHPAGRR